MKKTKSLWAPVLIACGALTSLPFMVGELWILAWLTTAPMIYHLIKSSPTVKVRRAYGIGFAFGIGYYGMMYHWFINFYPMDFAGLNETESVGVIALCWLGLATMHSLELGAVTMVYRLISPKLKHPALCVATVTAAWATFEWTQTLGWRGVPWGRLALSQWKLLPAIQSASLFGSIFVSALIIAVNALIAVTVLIYQRHRRESEEVALPNAAEAPESAEAPEAMISDTEAFDEIKAESSAARASDSSAEPTRTDRADACGVSSAAKTASASLFCRLRDSLKNIAVALKTDRAVRLYALAAIGLFVINALFGVIRMAAFDEKKGEPITAAVIQGNISSLDKWAENTLSNSIKVHLDLTLQCVEETGADIVLWAETSIPVNIDKYPGSKQRIANTAKELGIVLIIGAFETGWDPEAKESAELNALITFLPDGTELDTRYYKRHLVPFAESLPLEGFIRTFLPILIELNLIREPLAPGTSANVFETELGNIGGIICYDSIFPALSLDSVRSGAELIAISTNDSWFSDSAAIYQHNRQAAMRALETGRYVIRSANTGISSIITPEGRFLTETEPLVECYTSATVYMRSDSTLYSCIGDLFAYLCLGFTVGMLGFSIYKAIYKKRHPMYSEP